jgi:hypothetical protein
MNKVIARTGLGMLASILILPALLFSSGTQEILWSVTSFGANDYFQEPSDVEVDRTRSLIYVVDAGSSRVLAFDFQGKFVRAIGSKGQGPGEFTRPTGAALLPDGGLAVADFAGSRIGIFDPAGKFVRSITVTEARVADLAFFEGRFYTVPMHGSSGHAITMASQDRSQPLVNVLDEQGKRVLEISTSDFPETHPFIRAIKHRVCLAVSPQGKLFLPFFGMNRVHVYERTGQKSGDFTRPLPFRPIEPALAEERSPEKGIVQMRAKLDFVSLAAGFGPDGRLYILTLTKSLAEIQKTDPDLKEPLPLRIDVVDPASLKAVTTLGCDPGVKAFGLMDGGRLVYVYEDAEGELALRCVRY